MNGILELCERFGIDKGEITRVLHGTTTATNAILEQDGCTVGMITTEGYRDGSTSEGIRGRRTTRSCRRSLGRIGSLSRGETGSL